MRQLLQALSFAAHKHRSQKRKGRDHTPYINHPIALANVLLNEAGVDDEEVLVVAILHDTVEDTQTTPEELEALFGREIASLVLAVTDDKSLPKAVRKRLQVEHAPTLPREARLVKLADKICNIRDVARDHPVDWSLERRREYFDWARAVVDSLRGTNARLEELFDEAYRARP